MTIPDAQSAVALWLAALAGRDAEETRLSAVFVGASEVWKLKKAVDVGFLDLTTPAARERILRRELAVNADAAAPLYRDVVAIVRDGETLRFDPAPAAPPLDWVLRMARVPAADFLPAIMGAGRLDPALQDRIADAVAALHRRRAPARVADPAAAIETIVDDTAVNARAAGLDPVRVEAWHRDARRALDSLAPTLRARGRAGLVRPVHGDLHLGNLCLHLGAVLPFDALEFSDALATIDLGYDLAFLLMDLCRAGRAEAATRILGRYVGRTGDVGLLAPLPLFLSLRAMIRAHAETVSDPNGSARALDAAAAHLRPGRAAVVAIGGLPGTGKTTVARLIAPTLGPQAGPAPGALVLRSDEIRKRLAGVAPEDRLEEGAYGPVMNARVDDALVAGVAEAAAAGHPVIADATFVNPALRRRVAGVAGGHPFLGLWLEAPQPILEARIDARHGDASDATVAVLRGLAARDPGPGAWRPVDASDTRHAARVIGSLLAGG